LYILKNDLFDKDNRFFYKNIRPDVKYSRGRMLLEKQYLVN
jgi:hypothetical protein